FAGVGVAARFGEFGEVVEDAVAPLRVVVPGESAFGCPPSDGGGGPSGPVGGEVFGDKLRGHSITPGRTEGPLGGGPPDTARSIGAHHTLAADQVATPIAERSEERRVGKECRCGRRPQQ